MADSSSSSPSPGVRLDVSGDGDVARLNLDRPDRLNAQTPALWREIVRLTDGLPGTVRVLIVRGAGRAFSAGLDRAVVTSPGPDGLPALLADGPDAAAHRIATFQDAFTALRRPGVVSVAAVHGHAVGAGFQLALACDLRVVTTDAVFRMAEVSLGLVPDLTGTRRLLDLVGYTRALDLCVTGRPVGAAEADRLGLVSRLVDPADLDAAVDELTAQVLTHNRDAVAEIVALFRDAAGRSEPQQFEAERRAQVRRLTALLGGPTR